MNEFFSRVDMAENVAPLPWKPASCRRSYSNYVGRGSQGSSLGHLIGSEVNRRLQLGVYIVTHFMAGDAECFRIREFERGIKSGPRKSLLRKIHQGRGYEINSKKL
jgi:hypothetical protein